jgi:hypothetical protein
MLWRLVFVAICLSCFSPAGSAWAQEPATLLLKSGERVTGELVDMGGSDFTVRVNGQDRRIGIGDVAVLDFTGDAQNLPAAELAKAGQVQNLLVLRNGQQVEGKLDDVGGTRPLRITFVAGGQSRDYTSSDVGRIYLAQPSSAVAGSGQGRAVSGQGGAGSGQGRAGSGQGRAVSGQGGAGSGQGGAGSGQGRAVSGQGGATGRRSRGASETVNVPATQEWTNTGIDVSRGQVVRFSTSGSVQLSRNARDIAEAAGRAGTSVNSRAPIRDLPRGALLGRINDGRPFGIGDQAQVTMPESGTLYLGINDDSYSDNSGQFVVTVTPQAGSATMPRR